MSRVKPVNTIFVAGGGGGEGEEIRAPLKTPAWEAMTQTARKKNSEYL